MFKKKWRLSLFLTHNLLLHTLSYCWSAGSPPPLQHPLWYIDVLSFNPSPRWLKSHYKGREPSSPFDFPSQLMTSSSHSNMQHTTWHSSLLASGKYISLLPTLYTCSGNSMLMILLRCACRSTCLSSWKSSLKTLYHQQGAWSLSQETRGTKQRHNLSHANHDSDIKSQHASNSCQIPSSC